MLEYTTEPWAPKRWRRWFLAAAALCLLGGTASGDSVALNRIVPDYMEGNLETAITPTPQMAELKDTAFVAGKTLIVYPDTYAAPDTLFREATGRLGNGRVTATNASSRKNGNGGTRPITRCFSQRPWPLPSPAGTFAGITSDSTALGRITASR